MRTQNTPIIARRHRRRYLAVVTAKSATGFGDPIKQKAHKRHQRTAGAFFVPAIRLNGGCAWDTFGYAGFLLPRFANLRTAATQYRLATISGGSSAKGALPMKHARKPSTPNSHADACKAMALAALRADSSLSVRLARYNHHMAKARALETAGGAV
jgi:hypothetical protein